MVALIVMFEITSAPFVSEHESLNIQKAVYVL